MQLAVELPLANGQVLYHIRNQPPHLRVFAIQNGTGQIDHLRQISTPWRRESSFIFMAMLAST